MNIPFLGSWLDPYPQLIDHSIPKSGASFVRFNRQGNYLAGACSNGSIAVWDVATMTILRILHGHASPVLTITWSRSGRYIASGGSDWQCLVWDVSLSTVVAQLKFDSTVIHVDFHPIKRNIILVSLAKTVPQIINIDSHSRSPILTSIPDDHNGTVHLETGHLDGIEVLANYDALGLYILCGTSKGVWSVIDSSSLLRVFEDKISGSAIHGMSLSRCGTHLAITVADKSIRTYALPYVLNVRDLSHWTDGSHIAFECVPMFKLQDLVNRFPWTGAAWTPSADHIVGATAGRAHALCIWNSQTGTLVHILEGPSEGIISFSWHPTLPMCVTVTGSGLMSVFNTTPKDRWSAYAPDFKEIEDNIEYEEQEDEFDIDPKAIDPLAKKMDLYRPTQGPLTAVIHGYKDTNQLLQQQLDLDTIESSSMDPTSILVKADTDADLDTEYLVSVRLEDPPLIALPLVNAVGVTASGLMPLNIMDDCALGFKAGLQQAFPPSHDIMASLNASAMGLVSVQADEPTRLVKRKRDD